MDNKIKYNTHTGFIGLLTVHNHLYIYYYYSEVLTIKYMEYYNLIFDIFIINLSSQTK